MLHASQRITAHFLTQSRFALIPLRILVQIHYSSDAHMQSHTQTLWVNSCLHVYLHIVVSVPKATQTEDLMNCVDKSCISVKGLHPLSIVCIEMISCDLLAQSFPGNFLTLLGSAGPSALT